MRDAKGCDDPGGNLSGEDQGGPHGVIEIVIHVSDDVGQPDDLPLEGCGQRLRRSSEQGAAPLGMLDNSVSDLGRKIQSRALLLQNIDNPQALADMAKTAGNKEVEDPFPRMPEGCMAEIVPEGDGFGQVLVEGQGAGNRPGDLRDLEGMGRTRAARMASSRS